MSLIFPLITFPYASRILLPEGLGKVNFALSIISYFAIISSLGIENYGIREAAKLRDDKVLLSQFTKEIFFINLVSTVIAYILLFVAIALFPKLQEYKTLLYVTSATILFTTLGMNWLYSAVEDYFYITVRSIVFQIISLVFLFVFVKTKDDYVKYAAISVVSNVGSNLLNFIHSRKYITFKTGIALQIKKHIKPIFVLFAMAVAVKIYTALDTTMLGFIKGDFEVGIYTAATKINKIVLSLVTAAMAVMLPRLSYYAKNKDKTKFNAFVYKGFDFLLLISIPCAIGLSILSEPIINLFCGNNYNNAVLPMRIMNPIVVIIGLSGFIGIQIFMPLNKEIWTLYSVLSGAIVNFTLNFILIPKYGVVGAAVATLVAETSVTVVQLILARDIIPLKNVFYLFLKYFANSISMCIVVSLCLFFIKNQWLQLFIGVFAGILVYSILLLFERNPIFLEVLKSIKSKF